MSSPEEIAVVINKINPTILRAGIMRETESAEGKEGKKGNGRKWKKWKKRYGKRRRKKREIVCCSDLFNSITHSSNPEMLHFNSSKITLSIMDWIVCFRIHHYDEDYSLSK